MTKRWTKSHSPGSSVATQRPNRNAGDPNRALIAISMDLEMSRHYPVRGAREWDYCKGDLDDATKQYAVEVCRRVKEAGGFVHAFLLGRTLEQADVDWLKALIQEGHAIGNHTYDHIKINARTLPTLQMRFQRCPWLIEGFTQRQAIERNIRLTENAMQFRLEHRPEGFRTPYGFPAGLQARPDLQAMLLEMGYDWVSSQYVQPRKLAKTSPSAASFAAIARCVARSQPYVYPSGLAEIPLSPITDVNAFRTRKWKLAEFAESVRRGVQWAIDHQGVYDYCFHPSVMCVEDPEFRIVDLICALVDAAPNQAILTDLTALAQRTLQRAAST